MIQNPTSFPNQDQINNPLIPDPINFKNYSINDWFSSFPDQIQINNHNTIESDFQSIHHRPIASIIIDGKRVGDNDTLDNSVYTEPNIGINDF
jgi:hypothetical protein